MKTPRRALGSLLPSPAILVGAIGSLSKHIDYAAAKHGDFDAAMRLAADTVTDELIDLLRPLQADAVLGVLGQEAFGPNAIPTAAAAHIAKHLNIALAHGVVKLSGAIRTDLDGLERVLSRPTFIGKVTQGARYILLDDTLTQGGTVAALAEHLDKQGADVAAVVALAGKQYSCLLVPTQVTLERLRSQLGDMEDAFLQATSRQFDDLTESEARYLANFKPSSEVRQRIATALEQRMGEKSGSSTGH
jgi:adenine/guanine phosphoribosyltransferase-like PRPP-binding protein